MWTLDAVGKLLNKKLFSADVTRKIFSILHSRKGSGSLRKHAKRKGLSLLCCDYFCIKSHSRGLITERQRSLKCSGISGCIFHKVLFCSSRCVQQSFLCYALDWFWTNTFTVTFTMIFVPLYSSQLLKAVLWPVEYLAECQVFFFLIERSLTVTKVNVNALKISLHTCNKGLKFSDLLKPIKLLFIRSHTGLYYRKGFQQAEENYCFLLLCTCETTSEVLCPVWGSSVQERHGGTGVSPAESHRDGQGTEACDV